MHLLICPSGNVLTDCLVCLTAICSTGERSTRTWRLLLRCHVVAWKEANNDSPSPHHNSTVATIAPNMTFIETLWGSLAQTHAMPHSSTFSSNSTATMLGQQPTNSTSQRLTQQDSEQQAAQSYSESSSYGSYQHAQPGPVQNTDATSRSNGSISGLIDPSTR